MCKFGNFEIGLTLETQQTITPTMLETNTYLDTFDSKNDVYNSIASLEEYKEKDTFSFSWSRGSYGNSLKNTIMRNKASHYINI